MENFEIACFHRSVQFARAKAKIYTCLLPLLAPFAKFLRPCDTIMKC